MNDTFNHDEIVHADWDAMDAEQQRTFFGENGFVLVPQALQASELDALLEAIQSYVLPHCPEGLPYSTEKGLWGITEVVALIENAPVLQTLRNVLGNDLRFFKGAYVTTPKGTQDQPLHLDQGTSGFDGDYRNSSASWINVGFYLTDLSPEHSPLWVVPGSNKYYHLTPGVNLEYLRPKAKMVLARAGDAVLFHRSTVHARGANSSESMRHGLFLSYRPAWAKPTGPVPEWPESLVEKITAENRSLVIGLNDGI